MQNTQAISYLSLATDAKMILKSQCNMGQASIRLA